MRVYSFKAPGSLIDRIDEIAISLGVSRSEVIREALVRIVKYYEKKGIIKRKRTRIKIRRVKLYEGD